MSNRVGLATRGGGRVLESQTNREEWERRGSERGMMKPRWTMSYWFRKWRSRESCLDWSKQQLSWSVCRPSRRRVCVRYVICTGALPCGASGVTCYFPLHRNTLFRPIPSGYTLLPPVRAHTHTHLHSPVASIHLLAKQQPIKFQQTSARSVTNTSQFSKAALKRWLTLKQWRR